MILNYRKSKYKWVWITFFCFFAFNFLFFAATTYGELDRMISDYITPLMKYLGVRIWTCFSGSIGSLTPIWVGFIVLTIFIESHFMYIKNGVSESKYSNFIKSNSSYIAWVWYALMFIAGCLYTFLNTQHYPHMIALKHWSGFSVRMLSFEPLSIITTSIATSITLLLVIVTAYLFRFKISKNNKLIENRYWAQGIKIVFLFVFSYSTIFLGKHFFGRPYYFSIILTEHPKYGNGQSISEIIAQLHLPNFIVGDGNDGNDGNAWINVPFKAWYDPNHILQNLKYWFRKPVSFSNPNNDDWWNMDFPSGHTTAITLFVSLSSLFFYHNRKTKLNIWHKLFIIISLSALVSMQVSMVVLRFHWTSDVTFSLFVGILWWWLADTIVEKRWIKWIYRARNNNNNVGEYNVIKLKENEKDIICFAVLMDNEMKIVEKRKISKKQTKESVVAKFEKKYKIAKLTFNDTLTFVVRRN